MPVSPDIGVLAERLAQAGCVAAGEEAAELVAAANGDAVLLETMVRRRLGGEPLAWVTGQIEFCGVTIHIDPGVYVPRWQSEALGRRATARLGENGTAIDLCTGSGALAKVMMVSRPRAQVVSTECDLRSVACARRNGVAVYQGDLFSPLPKALLGQVNVIVGAVPYVPTPALALLPRDTLAFESPLAYDGGPEGTAILRRVLAGSIRYLRPGGSLLLELGGQQADLLGDDLARLGYGTTVTLLDDDGDVRGIEATLAQES